MSFEISREDLMGLELKDYFKKLANASYSEVTLEELTNLFTNHPFADPKPYLYRRQLSPIDNRFTNIELVYDDEKRVHAITWAIEISLKELQEIFGTKPILQFTPHGESTLFYFKTSNPTIRVINSTFYDYIRKNKFWFGYTSFTKENVKKYTRNPQFKFIQFTLNY